MAAAAAVELLLAGLIAAATMRVSVGQGVFTNPVGPANTGDPGAAYDNVTRSFYFAETGSLFPIYNSKDLAVPWTRVGTVFSRATVPSWIASDNWWGFGVATINDGSVRARFACLNLPRRLDCSCLLLL